MVPPVSQAEVVQNIFEGMFTHTNTTKHTHTHIQTHPQTHEHRHINASPHTQTHIHPEYSCRLPYIYRPTFCHVQLTGLQLAEEAKGMDGPASLKAELMPHQRIALEWMYKKETGRVPHGGILADQMGLGKVLCGP